MINPMPEYLKLTVPLLNKCFLGVVSKNVSVSVMLNSGLPMWVRLLTHYDHARFHVSTIDAHSAEVVV